ncbi:MAG TPA: hypothetical protein VGN72_14680 [Tepidisphaeraceae bacterium]|jgi:hypothetical protein|nr:hypothetical protein [Tepidisphaeraceae bacterium]
MMSPFYLAVARAVLLLVGLIAVLPMGCSGGSRSNGWSGRAGDGGLIATDLHDTAGPAERPGPIALVGARNEWLSTTIRIPNWQGGRGARLRLRNANSISAAPQLKPTLAVMQLIAMPVDQSGAAFVRQAGRPAASRTAPRALLPVARDRNGEFDLSTLRDPNAPPGGPARTADGSRPVDLWIDLLVPAETPAGRYELSIELLRKPGGKPVAQLPLSIDVHDFVLPDDRHLTLAAKLDWDDLAQHYNGAFQGVSPRLVNRTNPRFSDAVRVLDRLMTLAQSHRTSLFVPQLQPTVKWPSGEPPSIDWNDYDSIVRPWLSGDQFNDRIPLGFWALPSPDQIDEFDPASQREYWGLAASHFDQLDWLDRSAILLSSGDATGATGRANAVSSIRLSTEAAAALAGHPRLRVVVPLNGDQVQFAGPSTSNRLVPPEAADRLVIAAPGLISAPPIQNWPRAAGHPRRWMRTDVREVVPATGAAGGEHDVRLWAWLAFLRDAGTIIWNDPLPSQMVPQRSADPANLVWFYPGHWFGQNDPVPTVHLKWLRRAEQDYEYLYLASQRGETTNTRLLAELLAKPVEVQPNQNPDPVYGLLTGTTDAAAWDGALQLVARSILLRPPGQLPDLAVQHQLELETRRWTDPQQRPVLVARSSQWLIDPLMPGRGISNWIDLRCGIDIYNTAATDPTTHTLQWTGIGAGWRVPGQPTVVRALDGYRVRRVSMDARVNLGELGAETREPLEITFTHGFTRRETKLQVVVPAAALDRRDEPLTVDGSLGDWREVDAIGSGALVKMLSRPTVQQGALERMSTPVNLYANWADDAVNVAFRVEGLSSAGGRVSRNFIEYDLRRAWGEDVCEVLMQPVYADNSVGPTLNVTLKPTSVWVERKLDARTNADPWAPLEGAAVRYAATVDGGQVWRGEITVPWKAIGDPAKGRPVLLRFNFSQHRAATGESGSWAGPIDFGRDDAFTGILHIRDTGAFVAPGR